ncbi:MAG: FHA domain-containing protein [Pyrinomonadaceae bacterium]
MQVVLKIYSSNETKQVLMAHSEFTIGRSGTVDLLVPDSGVSATHATIYRDGERVWILDDESANGTAVDGRPVPPSGATLYDGAEISIGHDTTIVIEFRHDTTPTRIVNVASPPQEEADAIGRSLSVPIIVGSLVVLLILAAVVVLASHVLDSRKRQSEHQDQQITLAEPSPELTATPSPQRTTGLSQDVDVTSSPTGPQSISSHKLYLQMTPPEQMEFIDAQARHISMMMGNRPYTFNDDVLRYIKQYLDGYAKRVGNNSSKLWGEDLRSMFGRAREQYAPYIIRSFNARGVPPVVGLYLVVVETEYHNIQSENAAGAAGLFQFIGPTARGYGVDPSERTNVAKMAPAAAAYMSDRIAEFGPDSMSVALAIAGYNRSPDSVRRDLRDVLNSENRERSFWTLVANSDKLDHYFQGENIKYVPKFFAAAIVGETPWAFGLQMQPLSTYTDIKNPPSTTADSQ